MSSVTYRPASPALLSIGNRPADVLNVARAFDDRVGANEPIVDQHIPFALGLADHYAVLERSEIVAEGKADATAFESVERYMRL